MFCPFQWYQTAYLFIVLKFQSLLFFTFACISESCMHFSKLTFDVHHHFSPSTLSLLSQKQGCTPSVPLKHMRPAMYGLLLISPYQCYTEIHTASRSYISLVYIKTLTFLLQPAVWIACNLQVPLDRHAHIL